jgi:dTDP-4-amino-4,6-dideoxygalactose transaminase
MLNVMNKPVPFLDIAAGTAELQDAIERASLEVIRSGWYLLGDKLRQFESEFSAFLGVEETVGVGNGLDALTLSLQAMGIGPGDEVIVPAHTYIATWLAVTAVGATIVPIECEMKTFLPTTSSFASAITGRSAVFLPVHLYGRAVDMEGLAALAERHGLRILEDCAQAHGATWHGKSVGTTDVGAWSFYPGKNLGAMGDGGAVTTSHSPSADTIRVLRNYGSRQKYHNECIGVNSRLDEIQAAILSVKLRVLGEWNSRREAVANRYGEELQGIDWLSLPEGNTEGSDAWHLYVVGTKYRDQLQEHLNRLNIGTIIHYPIPPHLQPAYEHLGFRSGAFPIAEQLAKTSLSLPIGPHLAESEQQMVIEAVRSFEPKAS